jgi:hypothetical protein
LNLAVGVKLKPRHVVPIHMNRGERASCPVEEWTTVGRLGGATCGAVGFGLALVALAFGYSGVVAVASVVPLLSTTAVVFTGVLLWLVSWLGLVVAVEAVRTRLVDPPDTTVRP